MISNALDFKYLLLDSYSKLKIKEDELAVILLIDHLLGQGNDFITADLLSIKMNYSIAQIDKILASLINKGYLEYKSKNKKTTCSLAPLRKKLIKAFENDISKEETSENVDEIKNKVDSTVKEIETLFKRNLSPVEIGKVKDWILYGYDVDQIVEATKEAISKKTKSIKGIDKILSIWQSRNDIETDGISTITPDWNKSLEETIKIAKTPWLDDEEFNKR